MDSSIKSGNEFLNLSDNDTPLIDPIIINNGLIEEEKNNDLVDLQEELHKLENENNAQIYSNNNAQIYDNNNNQQIYSNNVQMYGNNNNQQIYSNNVQMYGNNNNQMYSNNVQMYENNNNPQIYENNEINNNNDNQTISNSSDEVKTEKKATKKGKKKQSDDTPKTRKNGLVEGVDFVWRVSKSGTRYKYKYQLSKQKTNEKETPTSGTKAVGKKKMIDKFNSENQNSDGTNDEQTPVKKKETATKKKASPKKRKNEDDGSEEEDGDADDENEDDKSTPQKKRKNGLVEGVDFVWRVSKSGTKYKYKYKPTKNKKDTKNNKDNKNESTEYENEYERFRDEYVMANNLDKLLFPKWLPNTKNISYISQKEETLYGPKNLVVKIKFKQQKDIIDLPFGTAVINRDDQSMIDAVANCGGMIKDVAWAPVSFDDDMDEKQFIVVASYNDIDTRYFTKKPIIHKGVLQIWQLDCKNKQNDNFIPRMFLCHEYGAVHQLKFCPMSATKVSKQDLEKEFGEGTVNRMGILAAAFTDGKVRVFSVPYPSDLKKDGLFIKIDPILTFQLSTNPKEPSLSLCLDWTSNPYTQPSLLMIGGTLGSLGCFNLTDIYKTNNQAPLFHFIKDSSPVLTVSFNPYNYNEYIFGNSHGYVYFCDLRFPEFPRDSYYPGYSWVTSSFWTHYNNFRTIVLCHQKNILRFNSHPREGKFILSTKQISGQTVWQVSSLPFTNLLSSCSYNGTANLHVLDKPKHKQKVFVGSYFEFNVIKLTNLKDFQPNPELEQPEDLALLELAAFTQNLPTYRYLENVNRDDDVYLLNNAPNKRFDYNNLEQLVGPEDISVNCVCMNSNIGWFGWVVSGSSNGLLRVQNLRAYKNTSELFEEYEE